MVSAHAKACALHHLGGPRHHQVCRDARIEPYNKDIVTLDDHVRDAIERVLAQVRAPLDGTLRELAGTIAIEARAADVRVTDALRLLDEAASFGEVLTVLADCVGREVERSVVLVVASGRLKGWHSSGFSGVVTDAKTIELPLDPKGLLGVALSTKTSVVSRASTGRIPSGRSAVVCTRHGSARRGGGTGGARRHRRGGCLRGCPFGRRRDSDVAGSRRTPDPIRRPRGRSSDGSISHWRAG